MEQGPATVIEVPKEGPKVGFWLNGSLIAGIAALALSGVVMFRDMQNANATLTRELTSVQREIAEMRADIRERFVSRAELDLLRERDANANFRLEDHERRLRDLEGRRR